MFKILFYTFLFSLLPFGEARLGIPYAVFNEVHFVVAFAVGVIGNLLVFPLLTWLIDRFNARLWPYAFYKKNVVRFSRLAKKGVGNKLEKYGFWGLMLLVMVPMPGTGAYTGTIAAALFKVDRRKAFLAVSIGTFVSCALMATAAYLGILGWSMLQ